MKPAALDVRRERGAALLETALTMPLLLLIAVGIFDFGRAYQTWQVMTNAAREAARAVVIPNAPADAATTRVMAYLTAGQIPHPETARVSVTPATIDLGGGATASGSQVTVTYPFQFMVLEPIAKLVVRGSTAGEPITMTASAVMRNE